jgi:V/A-type H+-transporting ATPase subunit I
MFKAKPMTRLFMAGLKEQMASVIQEIYRQHLFHVQGFSEARGEDYEGFRMGMPLPGAGEAAAQLVTVRGLLSTLGISRETPESVGKKPAPEVRAWLETQLPRIRNDVENEISRRRSILETDRKKYDELCRIYDARLAEIQKELARIEEKAEEIRKAHADWLLASEELLMADVEQKEIPLQFATTEQAFVAEGWVPAPDAERFISALQKATGGKIFVTEVPMDEVPDQPPVEYNNPSFARPAELFMDVYARPKYTEIDPTILLSIVFPLFFGLIVGDAGYGLLFLAMAYGMRRFLSGPEGRMLLTNLRNASLSSLVFGILFSEFFGFRLPWAPVLFSRHLNIGGEAAAHGPAIPELMVLSIWIGVLHITLGRFFGIINHARQDHGRHRTLAVLANVGWLCVMWGILTLIWSQFALPLMPDLTGAPSAVLGLNLAGLGGAVALLAGIILIARDSVLEIIEIPTIISHVLSYARLVAVGLSSVAIAMVVNFIAIGMIIQPQLENLSALGIVIIIMGVLVFLIGHTLNIALGLLGGGLHSIRLHYVEWFTKFYKGGGEKYTPLGMIRRFTED